MRAITWVDAGELAGTLNAIKGFACKDDCRPTLAELKFEIVPSRLHLVACDTYRLATVDLEASGKRAANLYLPRAKAAEIAKALRKFDQVGIVRHQIEGAPAVARHLKDPKRCYLGLSDRLTTERDSRKPFGYPDYQHLIPRRASRKWRLTPINLSKWAESLRAIQPEPDDARYCSIRIAAEADGDVRLEWRGPKGSGDLGRVICYRSFVALHGGTPLPVIVNRKYLLEAVRFMGGLPTKIYIHGENSPIEFTNGRRSVSVMPILAREWDQ